LRECVTGKGPDDYVFTRGSSRIVEMRDAWKAACEGAGCPGLLFHDLRRSGVRNLVRAGVTEKVAMTISGHKTRAVFERYNIVNQSDLRDAARKLDRAAQGRRQQEMFQAEMFSPPESPPRKPAVSEPETGSENRQRTVIARPN
jgi:hypothetical protein